ncbi:hypothetical protein BDS110ZK18_36650 [Bradyrhizobium diazoefficiens]|uniref:TNase-like domain-containing protein n=1 Tax=Bradyrhizobium diazoefficiens TaxID=1355477 RepID=A0A809XM13_9BRAD|nr:hypothetical protein XF2B_07400 [Bradyrhizobium diazoefficiens]BCF14049.1 hypothetical protein XF13B_07400 [Bradyrhizobium diazoefficiens]
MCIRIILVLSMLIFSVGGLRAVPIDAAKIQVVDGDTIKIGGTTYRLIGYDTPELTSRWRTVGPDEKALATIAKERLEELIRKGALDLEAVPCSCSKRSRADGTCNFGRKCAILYVDGRNVGEQLIAEELAVPFVCGPHRCPRMPDWTTIIQSYSK